MDRRLLGIYLNDHLAGAVAAREVAKRCLQNNADSALADLLRPFIAAVDEDRESLVRLMDLLELPRNPVKAAAGWAGEKVGRLKLNGRLLGYSPLSRLEELEVLALGVRGKLLMWRTLQTLAGAGVDERLDGFDFDTLIERAEFQAEELERYRQDAATDAFGG